MIITTNNDAARGRRGLSNSARERDFNLEQAEDTLSEERLQAYKGQIEEAQSDSSSYLNRNRNALDWCQARWPDQYTDGRKWAQSESELETIMPWPGSSDTRDRTVEMLVNDHVMVASFAQQNMKVQARSTHPLLTMRQSQQMTTLLNWQLFTQMKMEMHRELLLALNWRFIYGSSFIETVWQQERRLYRETIYPWTLQAWLSEGAGGGVEGQRAGSPLNMSGRMPELQAASLDEVAAALVDPDFEETMIALVQSMSPIMTKAEGRKAVKDLRELRYAEIKVVDVFDSRPRVAALRSGVDLLFDKELDDPQAARWFDRVERVPESVLMDRIETAGYDPVFVDEALEHKGEGVMEGWSGGVMGGTKTIYPNNRGGGPNTRLSGRGRGRDGEDELVELHHRYAIQHDRGVPVMFCTVLHMNVDREGKHEPYGYDHGQYPFHVMRNEYKDRPILSSEGIPEKAYTWGQELKAQFDAAVDRSDVALKPPMLTDSYEEVQKFKTHFMPSAIIPIRRHGSFEWMKPPQFDQGAALIVQEVQKRVREFFPLFGADVDPDKKQMYRGTLATNLMTEIQSVIAQIGQMDQQFLPDEVVAAVGGPSAQPIRVSRDEIRGQYNITATIDVRMIDAEFLDTMMKYSVQLAGLDTMGVLDRSYLVRAASEALSIDFAENAIQQTEPATMQEQQEEQKAIDLILASGMDQPLPKGGNYQLRMQTLQQRVQEALSTNPVVQRRVKADPEIMEVIQKRAEFFQNQLQQTENAQIGRMLTTRTFTKQAPVAQAMLGQS